MLTIINNTDIEYTKDDTFEMTVTSDGGFAGGSQLVFVIAQGEESVPAVNQSYDLNSDGGFTVTLSAEDKARLPIKESYIYKLVLKESDGTVITQKSGNFTVKWGA